ncbi:galactosyldiacylglycerol synthase [Bacillus songklensis]|uniref:Galactosyldiacylglycerol synthase n=1 Tax=Bacillus songklensis TaxID=1069116 RepID=A0ABV8BAH9_9BACI
MKKILFMPLFQMPSGHHKAADALMANIQQVYPSVDCKKIDFLSYWNEPIERMISSFYLKWIRLFPRHYESFYRQHMYHSHPLSKNRQKDRHWLFDQKLMRLLEEEKPDLVVCTHCFPSKLLSALKRRNVIKIPVINVYTDFFINDVWGIKDVDFHFVPDKEAKEYLMSRWGIGEKQIFVTGIPVHPGFYRSQTARKQDKPVILVAGGNGGLGNVTHYLKQVSFHSSYQFNVLCGNNQRLYEELLSWKNPCIKPLPYISDRNQMNELYNQADAIVTKAGGITLSEALIKRLPIFIHTALPGQEQINVEYLTKKQLIIPLQFDVPFEEQLKSLLQNDMERNRMNKRIERYVEEREHILEELIRFNPSSSLALEP